MIRLCSRFDSVLFTPKISEIPSYGNYSRSPMIFSAMMAATAPLAANITSAHAKNRLIVARWAAAGRTPAVSRLVDESGARLKRPRVSVSIVIIEIL
jgi:hypothetical protein